jgi:hypothetical protein
VEALQFGSREGTVFFNAMADAALTIGGRFEKLKDTSDQFMERTGEQLLPSLSIVLEQLNGTLEGFSSKGFAQVLENMIKAGIELAKSFRLGEGLWVLGKIFSGIALTIEARRVILWDWRRRERRRAS